MYRFDEEKLLKEIAEKNPSRILLQMPEGLKKDGLRIASLIQEKQNVEVVLSGEPLWGACDIATAEAKAVGADLIVIYGHAPFMKVDFPIIYVEARFETDITPLLKKVLEQVKDAKRIIILSSVQHLHQIPITESFFKEQKIETKVPEAKGHAFYDGQVLGCEYNALKSLVEKDDLVLVIANNFHALGAAMSVENKVILLDPCTEKIEDLAPLKEKIIKQRGAALAKAQEAEKIGVIIGTKIGQKFGSFEFVKEKLKKLNKKYVLLSMGEITNEKLINLHDIDVFVELACPRIAVDAASLYEKPLLTAREFAVLCGDITWNDLLKKGFL